MTDRTFRVVYDQRAAKELSKLDRTVARRIHLAITALADDPRPSGCRQLAGYPGLWRTRVGDYRVIYQIDDDVLVVLVLRIGHRGKIYDRL